MSKKGSKYPQLNDREWLYQKYWAEELSSRKIAEIVGCEKTAVLDALKRCNVQIRKRKEWLKEKLDKRLFDKKWLYCKYWIDGLSTREMGLIIGCDRKTIQMSLKRYNIPRRSYSESIRGEVHPLYKKQHTEKTKEKIRKALSSIDSWGENNPSWKGGISFEPYCPKFNDTFKDYIREKFNRKCFLCGKTEEENGRRLSVHHVNYNKKCGCEDDMSCQFVPLCLSCHNKTNVNREYWERLISRKMHEKINGWYI